MINLIIIMDLVLPAAYRNYEISPNNSEFFSAADNKWNIIISGIFSM